MQPIQPRARRAGTPCRPGCGTQGASTCPFVCTRAPSRLQSGRRTAHVCSGSRRVSTVVARSIALRSVAALRRAPLSSQSMESGRLGRVGPAGVPPGPPRRPCTYSCSTRPRPVCQQPASPRPLRDRVRRERRSRRHGACGTRPSGGRGRDVPVRRRATRRRDAVRQDGYAGGPRVGWMPSAMPGSPRAWVDATAWATSSNSDGAGVRSVSTTGRCRK